jgi:hypothetical protein
MTFQMLKQKLISQPILQCTDFSNEYKLTTDAFNEGAGAVLSRGEIGKDRPKSNASRSFNRAENYSVVEKELAAIFWGFNHFRPYLYGKR